MALRWLADCGVVIVTREGAMRFGWRPNGGPEAGLEAASAEAGEPRLLICDVDGTLLDQLGTLRPIVRAAIARVRAAGVTVAVATGRSPWAAAEVCRELGLGGPQITMNGGTFGSPVTGELVWARCMSADLVLDGLAFARAVRAAPLMCFLNRHAAEASRNAPAVEVPDFAVGPRLHRVESLDQIADDGPIRMYIPTGPARHFPVLKAAYEWFGPRGSIVWSDEEGLEILAPRTNKGEAVRAVAASMGLDRGEVAAIGDGPNDLEMLAYAGLSAALLPAPTFVRAVAGLVAPSSADDGAVQAMCQFFPATLRDWQDADEDPDPDLDETAA